MATFNLHGMVTCITNALELCLSCTKPSIYPCISCFSYQGSSVKTAFDSLNHATKEIQQCHIMRWCPGFLIHVYLYYVWLCVNTCIPVFLLHHESAVWWRHQMETFSALLATCAGNSPISGEFPAQRPVKRSFDIFFDLRLNKRSSKQSLGWWFEMLSFPLWHQWNGVNQFQPYCTHDGNCKGRTQIKGPFHDRLFHRN